MKKLKNYLLLLILLSFSSIVLAVGEKVKNPFNNHQYQFYNIPMTWNQAKAFCEREGGYLATPTTKAENEFIYQNVAIKGGDIWLGATDEASEGNWQWITGETWDYTDWSSSPYRQPDNAREGQDYLAYYSDTRLGTWDDQGEAENWTIPFICEWDDSSNKTIVLTGLWSFKDNKTPDFSSYFELIQSGNKVESFLRNVSKTETEKYGFQEGQKASIGILEGNLLKGKGIIHFHSNDKQRCPNQWQHWVDVVHVVSDDSNTLTGSWDDVQLNSQCQLRKTGERRQNIMVRKSNISIRPTPTSIKIISWGNNPDQFALQQGEETETFGPYTFNEDAQGNRYIVDPVNFQIKVFTPNGEFLRSIAIEEIPQDILLDQEMLVVLNANTLVLHIDNRTSRYELSQEIPRVEGYGQGLWQDAQSNIYVCKLQECYLVVSKAYGTSQALSALDQGDSVMPGYPLRNGEQWLRVEWLSPQQVQIVLLNNEAEVLQELPLTMPQSGSFGAVSFIGQDAAGLWYFEVERVDANEYVHLEAWVVDESGLLKTKQVFPNDYYSTMYKKLSVDKHGFIKQLYTTEQGVEYRSIKPSFSQTQSAPLDP